MSDRTAPTARAAPAAPASFRWRLIWRLPWRIRPLLRAVLPLVWRQHWSAWRRQRADQKAGLRFASLGGSFAADHEAAIVLSQPVMPGALFENKVHNLKLGAQRLDGLVLAPGALFSFWHCIGPATRARGYLEGRNIIDGQLRRESGGGLCQLSSLLYHLALLGGMQVLERHAHSIDLYREDERFTPLGADATVVWGGKDLRWRNPHPQALRLRCHWHDGRLHAAWEGPAELRCRDVRFEREAMPGPLARERVLTRVDGQVLVETIYLSQPGLALR